MKPQLRRRLPAALRLIALAILALSMVLRPVASSMGEFHEFAHSPTGQHQDIGDQPQLASLADAGQAPEGDGAIPLHLLLHFAHCCGHTASTPAEVYLQAFNPPPATGPTWQPQTPLTSTRWPTPFRPPITA